MCYKSNSEQIPLHYYLGGFYVNKTDSLVYQDNSGCYSFIHMGLFFCSDLDL